MSLISTPVIVNPLLNKLITLRLSDKIYNGTNTKNTSLGFRLMESIIPDEALEKLNIEEILDFRDNTKDFYDNWLIMIGEIESKLKKEKVDISPEILEYLTNVEINPKLQKLKNEIRRIRDERFANIIKAVKNVGISCLVGGTLSDLNISAAILSFLATNIKTPQFTDNFINSHYELRNIERSNGLTYLLKINQLMNI